jgi:preprotein translocase subunit SecA
VIGLSHEARRIDNQLRGRSGRQGDPGSSRFYLSMEDELMRLFGGQQADNLMQRMKIDDDIPLEMGLVSRLVEQSQTRVEGANFDVRKHLLEYDDVLNTQRAKIYAQRNRIFVKSDLSEDVTEMLRAEVNRHIPEALQDPEGPWKLLAWLEQIQPPLQFGSQFVPSYMQKLILGHLLGDRKSGLALPEAIPALLEIADQSLQAEQDHLMRTVNALMEGALDRLESQLAERQEAVDTFFEGLSLEDETDQRSPRQLADELSAVLRLPLRFTPEQQRLLRDDPDQVRDLVIDQLRGALSSQAVARLVGSVERRLEESLPIDLAQLPADDWDALTNLVLDAIQATFSAPSVSGRGVRLPVTWRTPPAKSMDSYSNALLQLFYSCRRGRGRHSIKTTGVSPAHHAPTYVSCRKVPGGSQPEEITERAQAPGSAQASIRLAWG